MPSETFTRLLTCSLAFTVLFAASCKKEDNPGSPTSPQYPNADPILVQTPNGEGFYIDGDYHFADNVFAEADYLVTCPIYIMGGLSTVEPGVKFKFAGPEAGIYVTENGAFTALGTAEKPIQFVGVDTYPGAWKGIFFGTDNVNNKLEHCVIKHAGSSTADFMDENAAIGITRQHEDERNNCAWIKNTLVYGSAGFGIYVSSLKGHFLQFGQNTVARCYKAPLGMPFRLAPMITADCVLNPDTAQNTWEYVFLYNDGFNQSIDISEDADLINPGIPYRIRGTEGVTLIGADVTVAAGTVFEFDYEGGFCVRNGSLRAVGTPTAPVIFKGIQGGNGRWVGLSFHSASTDNLLVNCIVTGGGSKKSPLSDGKANVVLGSYVGDAGTVTVSNCQLTHSGGWGIAKKQASALTENGNQFTANAQQPDVYVYP